MKFILFILFWLCTTAFAGSIKYQKIFIFFINGVNTSPSQAQNNLSALEDLLSIKSNILKWDILYNPTSGNLAQDLWDALKQKRQESKEFSIDDYVITYMKSYHLTFPIDSPEYKKLKEDIKQHYIDDPSFVGRNLKDIMEQFHDKIPPPYEDVTKVLKEHDHFAKTKAYVLLIPHSQGNLYANQLWDVLVNSEDYPKSHIALFGIANPADNLAGTVEQPTPYFQKYVTADNDYIINSLNFLSTIFPTTHPAMPANAHLENCKDILCHNLIDSYIESDKLDPYLIYIPLSNLIVSLKNNLMNEARENNDIRLIFSMWGNTHLDLYNPFNQSICQTTGEGNKTILACDEDKFNYLDTTQGKFDDFERAIFAFKEQIPAGEYYILADLKKRIHEINTDFQFNSSFLGRIEHGWMYEFGNIRNCDNLQFVPHLNEYRDPSHKFYGLTQAFLLGAQSQYECLYKAPELLRNGRFYIGKVDLY